ncbi:MAG TPA: DUF983 domain-containing protein [Candidatus Nitrosopolaris sp.]|nr:DUF983 domain-containing protein [Candidatus Nitrosopolaris sp.]
MSRPPAGTRSPLPALPLQPPPAARVLGRALRLRCPRCGAASLYGGFFAMHESCAVCELRFEREPGYFVGAIYINYAVTAAAALGSVFLLDVVVGLSLRQELMIGVGLGVLVPVVFFRYARSLWLALDYLVTRADERGERARRRQP